MGLEIRKQKICITLTYSISFIQSEPSRSKNSPDVDVEVLKARAEQGCPHARAQLEKLEAKQNEEPTKLVN